MIGTSTTEYVFIRGCILFLHNIAPASLLYCLLLLINPLLPQALHVYRASLPIEAWIIAEAAFFLIVFLPLKYCLQRPAIHPELLSREERGKLFERCNATVEDPERYLSQWLLGAKKEHVKREDVKEFMRWAFLNSGQVNKDKEYEDEIECYVRAMEKLLGREIPPGKGGAKSLRLTLDKVDCLHRSLVWYFCVSIVDMIMYWSMLYNGFHFHRSSLTRLFTLFPFRAFALLSAYKSPAKHLTYWHRPHLSRTQLPVLFIHGIGIGLYPYTNFLRDLNSSGEAGGKNIDIGIIALEIMPVSSRITHPALRKDVMVHEIQAIIKHHGWSRFVLVSHSYGSIIATHLLKSTLTAPMIGPIVFIDPVSFLLHLPDVAYNFTSRQPMRANEHLLWYFGSKDMGVAHALARGFFWTENIVWTEDLRVKTGNDAKGRNVTVVLGGRDLIVDAEAVKRYLTASSLETLVVNGKAAWTTKNGDATSITTTREDIKAWKGGPWTGSGLEILYFDHLDHGQVFDVEQTRRPVIEAIRLYSATG